MKLVTLYMDEEQILLARSEAKRRGVLKSDIYRRAMRAYLPKRKHGSEEALQAVEEAIRKVDVLGYVGEVSQLLDVRRSLMEGEEDNRGEEAGVTQ